MSIISDVYAEKSWTYTAETIKADIDRIPETERTSIIGYKISPAYYLYADVIPCYKYYTLQDTWAITTPEILTDFMTYIRTEKPLWVLTVPGEDNEQLRGIVEENYTLSIMDEFIWFYRLK